MKIIEENKNKSAITTKYVVNNNSIIVSVFYDEDGDWQFFGKEEVSEEDAIVVGGRIVDDVLAKYVIGMDDESLITFLHMMRNLGMEEALQEFGVQDGDTVKIADVEFEYFE